MMTVHQAKAFPDITCLSLDPGTISTKMLEMGWGCGGTPLSKADDTLWLATTKDVSQACSGSYYVSRRAVPVARQGFSDEAVKQLVNYLDRLVK